MFKFKTKSDAALEIAFFIVLLLAGIVALYPIYFIAIASISDPTYIASGQVLLFPRGINLSAYGKLLENEQIWIGYRNSLFYMVVGTVINLTVTLPAGYALSRKNLVGRRWLMIVFIITMYFNGGIIPTFLAVQSYGLIDSPLVLLLKPALNVYNLIIARSFFENTIPEPMYESVRMDGASNTRFFLNFVLPLSKPMIAVITLYYAVAHWNSYFDAMIYITSQKYQTLQVFLKSISAQLDASVQEFMSITEIIEMVRSKQLAKYAIVVVSIFPVLVLYPFIQRFFIQGIMIGAVKE